MSNPVSSSSILLCLLLACRLGHAGPVDLATEREHFESGASLFKQKRFVEAIDEYRSAYAVRKHPILLINIGLSYLSLRQPREALDAFDQYRRSVASPPAGVEAKVQGYESQARALLAESAPPPVLPAKSPPSVRTLSPPAPGAARPGARLPRPRWRLATGGIAIALGVGLIALGAVYLAIDGLCTSDLSAAPSPSDCPENPDVYDTVQYGAPPLAGGIALTIAGSLMIAWPGERQRASADAGGTGLHLALSF